MRKRNPFAGALQHYHPQAIPDPRHKKRSRSQRKRDAIEIENRDE